MDKLGSLKSAIRLLDYWKSLKNYKMYWLFKCIWLGAFLIIDQHSNNQKIGFWLLFMYFFDPILKVKVYIRNG